MHPNPLRHTLWSNIAVAVLILILSACSAPTGQPTGNPAATPSGQPGEITPEATATSTPTPLPDQVVLWIPEGADAGAATAARRTAAELVSGSGMDVVETVSLEAAGMQPQMRIVIALQPADAVALAAAYPTSRYLLITTDDVQPGENLSVLRLPVLEQAFLAGYTAAMAADQWKVGMLSRGDTATGPQIRDAFVNGARYLCGNCAPRYDPKLPLNYPVYAEATPGTWQAGLDSLKAQGVLVLFVDPSLETGDLEAAVGQAGMHLVTDLPAPENYEGPGDLLVARILIDLEKPLKEIWEELIQAKPGRELSANLSIQEVHGTFISEGRMRLVEQTRQLLEEGLIFPGQAIEKPEPTPQ